MGHYRVISLTHLDRWPGTYLIHPTYSPNNIVRYQTFGAAQCILGLDHSILLYSILQLFTVPDFMNVDFLAWIEFFVYKSFAGKWAKKHLKY